MEIFINSKKTEVFHNEISDFVIFSAESECENKAEIKIILDEISDEAVVRPMSLDITAEISQREIRLDATIPCKMSIEFPKSDRLPIFVFLYEKECVPQGENVRVFEAGEYTLDEIRLNSNEILYLAAGAVVHAHLYVEKAENVTICGRGILDIDGDYTTKYRRMARFHECKGLTVRDVTLEGPKGWTCAMFGCEKVTVDGINIMSWQMCGDGIDIVGSHNVRVQNCFIRSADDCVALKATDYCGPDGLSNVYNVKVNNCVFWNAQPGNAIEIGFETRCDEMYDIEFSDIDIIHCEYEGWQSGSAISIHNGDRAKIHDVVYRNIRIEDANEKLFDFKVMCSNYSHDEMRGSIENVLVENVSLVSGSFPPSVLSGYEPEDSLVKNIRFVNISAYGKFIHDPIECRMVVERCKNISFEVNDK